VTEFKEETVTTLTPVKSAALTGAEILIGHTLLEADLAAALGVSKATVARLRYEGLVPYVKISSGKPIYLVDSILAWLKSKEIQMGVLIEPRTSLADNEQEQERADRPNDDKAWGNGRTADDVSDD
jgi:hypothetical protein